MSVEALFEIIQESCLPGLWSKGVALARGGSVIEDLIAADEIIVRVHAADRPVSPRVSLWPVDEDWFCDCRQKDNRNSDICAHVAAAVIAAKHGQIQKKGGASAEDQAHGVPAGLGAPFVRYHFSRFEGRLALRRVVVRGDKEDPLTESLVARVGGLSSGRLEGQAIAASKEDFGADHILLAQKRRTLDPDALVKLLAVLRDSPNVFFEGQLVRTSPRAPTVRARLVDAGRGYKLEVTSDASPDEVFGNGAVLCGDVLRPQGQSIRLEERSFSPEETTFLVTKFLPELQKKMAVEVLTERLPKLRETPPRAVIRLEQHGSENLVAVPEIVYGDPAIARLGDHGLELLGNREIPIRDPAAEHALVRKLQNELQLRPGQLSRHQGMQAVLEFTRRLKGWEVEGAGTQAFAVKGTVRPRLDVFGEGVAVGFSVETGGGDGQSADPVKVFQAWKAGADHVALLGGGFAKLPLDWLRRFGPRIQGLLAARDGSGRLPKFFLPELARLCEEAGVAYPESLKKLRSSLETFEGVPETALPKDLRAELRPYQRKGVDWLVFLASCDLGAMLADDMGLGKTLQALCSVRGRTLIVCPTSVIYGWAGQLESFRPGLKYGLYHGSGRELDQSVDVVLTTYSILRLDREKLASRQWDTIVLDEAQTIKNPESQVARAAHELKAGFRIALTGTPIENRLDDLWSQFQFLNPGLLGSRSQFQEEFASRPSELKRRIKPFILRRLKRDVAPELPPRTEVVLHCELGSEEREVYQALYASTRKEVLEELEGGGNVMRALELLLRLRQACCHMGLVPGQMSKASAKTDLLLQTLESSLSLGHRALVFSQWTSYLDLIEEELRKAGAAFLRLDGGTPNRQAVVDAFQAESGPPVLLISLKAGGVGLTLTRADHIFLMDPWWNPSVEEQAADRAHRIGQKNPVLVHRLVARETLEERILELQARKKELSGSILDDGGAAARLTRDDLLALLR